MEFSFRDGWKSRRRSHKGESGQSLTEYLLVLVVVVAIIIAAIWLFSTAFKVWANAYFGEYLACLLETGELPSTGKGAAGGGAGNICNQFFEEFSLKKGRPLKESNNSKKGNNVRSRTAGNGARERSGGRGGSGSGGGGGSGDWGNSPRANQASNSDSGGGGGKTNTGNTGSSISGGYSSNPYGNGEQGGGRQLDGHVYGGLKKEEEKKNGYSSGTNIEDGSSTPQTHRLKPPKPKVAQLEDDQPMTFGNFLRLFIIAAIIIALVVLIGGQMLQIGKEME